MLRWVPSLKMYWLWKYGTVMKTVKSLVLQMLTTRQKAMMKMPEIWLVADPRLWRQRVP